MWNRLSRAVRSFIGFFISVAENPELILEQNIRDMNDQVPRMNESIAMVKANQTLLEKEEAKYKNDVADLTSKVKAAIQAGRDDIAGSYAILQAKEQSEYCGKETHLVALRPGPEDVMAFADAEAL